MDERQTQMMVVLGIVAVGAVLAAVYIEPGEETDDDVVETEDLAEVDPADVTSLTLVTPEGTLVADHSTDGWRLVQPTTGSADDKNLDDLVFLVDRLVAEKPIEGAALSEFGLDQPAAKMTLTLSDGSTLKLAVGDDTPVGYKSYIQWGDESEPRMAKAQPSATMGLPFDRYRDRGVIELVETAIDTVAWKAGPDDSWAVARGDGGWFLEDGRRAKASVIDGMLKEASALSYEGFFSDLTDMEAGLLPPRGELFLGDQGLTIGGEYAGGFIVRNMKGEVGTVGRLEGLVKPPGDILEDRLLAVPLAGLDQVTAQVPGGSPMVWASDAEGWTVDGEPDPLNGQTPFSLVSAVICDRTVQPESLGETWLTLTARSMTDEITVVIGQEVDGGGRVAQDRTDGPLMLLPDVAVMQLSAALGI